MTAYIPDINESDLKKFRLSLLQLASGRSNAYGTFTCTTSATTTTVTDSNCSVNSVIVVMPTTANASAEFGNGTIYVGTVSDKSFVVTHASSGTTGRTFKYAIVG